MALARDLNGEPKTTEVSLKEVLASQHFSLDPRVTPNAPYGRSESVIADPALPPQGPTIENAVLDPETTAALWRHMVGGMIGHRLRESEQAARERQRLGEEFLALVKQWKRDTARLSVFDRRMLHPAYRRITGLGGPAVRLVLEELRREPDHWFWALEGMTGENPAKSATSFQEAAEAWLRWGRERGEIEG